MVWFSTGLEREAPKGASDSILGFAFAAVKLMLREPLRGKLFVSFAVSGKLRFEYPRR